MRTHLLTIACLLAATSAGRAATNYGHVSMVNACAPAVQQDLQHSLAKMHDFEADPNDFGEVAQRDPHCALAYWGAAMAARGNPLAGGLDPAALRTGRRWLDKAIAVHGGAPPTQALIAALDVYYRPYAGGQAARTAAYEAAMADVHARFPDDPDVSILTALSMLEAVDLRDGTYARQRKAGALLEKVWATHPDHPGAPHYLIHAYDYPALAAGAEHAADVYPSLAPASSHAQHMPSHIWSMLGNWRKSISDNQHSGLVAEPMIAHTPTAEDTVYGHAFDFIAYARLQLAQDTQVDRDLQAMHGTGPFIVKARYAIERDDWAGAAALPAAQEDAFDAAVARFSRALGFARIGKPGQAEVELAALQKLRPAVVKSEGAYWGGLVDIYAEAAKSWIAEAEGKHDQALAEMRDAADHDDVQQKHILLENKLVPIRELLGDLLLAQGEPGAARAAYEKSLLLSPRRYRSLLGVARADAAAGDKVAARKAYDNLLDLTREADTLRSGMAEAKAYATN